jgi:xylan 1,4-beta-xylosidase
MNWRWLIAVVLLAPSVTVASEAGVRPAPLAGRTANGTEVDPVSVKVTVSWGRPVTRTTERSFGINLFAAFDPAISAESRYRENLAFMGATLVRFHSMEMMRDSATPPGWLNMNKRGWDRDKIRRALTWLPAPGVSAIMNIPGWPEWMDANGDGLLDRDRYDEFAALCASLVRIVNVDLKRGIKYWEITNEKDTAYWVGPTERREPDRIRELAEIYNACATAMKAVDPVIATGGPAAARGDLLAPLRQFALAVMPNLDFFTFHAYASGDRTDSDRLVYERADGLGWQAREAVRMLQAESPDRRIPVFLDEFNISRSWETRDPRMTGSKGAVFDTIVLAECARANCDSALSWNERDGIYGKTSPQGELRPGARILRLFNRRLVGDVVDAESANPGRVTALAVNSDARGERAVMVANRTDSRILIRFDFLGWKPQSGEFARDEIAGDGCRESKITFRELSAGGLIMPAHSVTFLAAKN